MKNKLIALLCVSLLLVGCAKANVAGEKESDIETTQTQQDVNEDTETREEEDSPQVKEETEEAEETLEPEEELFAGYETPDIDYELVWSDEFDGEEIDPEKWDFQYGDGSYYGVPCWGNNEKEYYTNRKENVRVEEGKLLITAIKEEKNVYGMPYTSARLRTMANTGEVLYATTYGRVEARIKLPVGDGIWPAFWMLPADQKAYGKWAASGEIDIMEVRGRLPRVVNGTLHYGGRYPDNVYSNQSYELPEDNDVTEYHIYAVEWEPEEIRWFVDDICYFKVSNADWYCKSSGEIKEVSDSAPFDVPFYILLNVAVGGDFDPMANMTDTVFPATMEVDYVRVYSRAEPVE